MSYYPESDNYGRSKIKVELDLSNYATKSGTKKVTVVDISDFTKQTNLASLKSGVDKLEVDKLKNVPTDLNKLRVVVVNDIVKKTSYDKFF